MKKCSKCGEVKPFEAFSKRADSGDGFRSSCKMCRSAVEYDRIARNREKINEQRRAYRLKNKERINELQRSGYIRNRKKILEQARMWREANRESIKEKQSLYRSANREKVIESSRKYKAANLESIKEKDRLKTRMMTAELSSKYIKRLLTKNTELRFADIPDWLVEAKREQLRLKRELRK